ncbi:MAG: bacteriohemerythrin [Halobacteriovoraceae bacterium]|nr:bacteriohemerythrin [Halobacteriovoraceae bacterium]
MALFEWNESFETGITSVDNQHKRLVDYVNRLHEGMMQGQASQALGVILEGLINYTDAHFKHEEKYFDKLNYKNAATHKEYHKKLVGQVLDFQKKFKDGDVTISSEIMDFLKDWLMDHILNEDMKFVDLFKENKVP